MRSLTTKTSIIFLVSVLLLGFLGAFTTPKANAESVSVSNSVSVSSDNGTAQSNVKTIVNGEVVVDESHEETNGTISFTSEYSSGDLAVDKATTSGSDLTPEEDARLRAELKRLLALLQYYVSLLNQ